MSFAMGLADLEDTARGAALLGAGGGGDPHIGKLLAARAIEDNGPVTVLDPDELGDDDFVIPTAMMGAPTVAIEKLPRGTEAVHALRALEAHLGRTAMATMPIECGGLNSMIPLAVAARTGLPIVDADGMGRAFPELQMETFSVYGISAGPMTVVGDSHDVAILQSGVDNQRLEWLARGLTIRLGGASYVAVYPMTGADIRRTAIPRTLTLCLRLGRALRQARAAHRDPLDALAQELATTQYAHLRVLFSGKVSDVERRTEHGFTLGRARVSSVPGNSHIELRFQNEHLIATQDERMLCVVPDLICVLDRETAEPITTEALRYGQRVTVIGISTPDIMRTPAALRAFGPGAFGLTQEFRPVEGLWQEARVTGVGGST